MESVWKRFGSTRVSLAPPKAFWIYSSLFSPTQNSLILLESVWPHLKRFWSTRVCLAPPKTVTRFGSTRMCLTPPKMVWVFSNVLGPTQNDLRGHTDSNHIRDEPVCNRHATSYQCGSSKQSEKLWIFENLEFLSLENTIFSMGRVPTYPSCVRVSKCAHANISGKLSFLVQVVINLIVSRY